MASPKVSAFRGLNNVTDPVRMGLPWLVRADNINVTSSGAVEKRAGRTRVIEGSLASAFATEDQERLYVVDGADLGQVTDDLSITVLVSGIHGVPMQWVEFNEQVYYSNGIDAGIVNADGSVSLWRWDAPEEPALSAVAGDLSAGQYLVCCTFVLPDGRETGPSTAGLIALSDGQALQIDNIQPGSRVYIAPADSTVFQLAADAVGSSFYWNQGPEHLGAELTTSGLDPLPIGTECIALWGGRMWASAYQPFDNKTVVWRSEPLAPHLFDLSDGFFVVNGRVLALAGLDGALVIGTDTEIHSYTPEGLTRLAPYGVVPGMPFAMDGKRLLIWSTRGLCQFPEFTNLTERRVSVAPGIHAGAAVIEQDGQARFLACLHAGGIAFNPRKEVSP